VSRPSEGTGGKRSSDLVNSGVRRVKAQVLGVKVARREDARRRRSEKIVAVHLRRTGGERSTDLANSGVRRLRVRTLGTPSREVARWREKDTVGSRTQEDRWI
jgi:hypothetical protein